MTIKTQHKMIAAWLGIILLQFARFIKIEIPNYVEGLDIFLLLIWMIYYMQRDAELGGSQIYQVKEKEFFQQKAKQLAKELQKDQRNFQILTEHLASVNTKNIVLTETISDLLQEQKSINKKLEEINIQKEKLEHELQNQKDSYVQMRKVLIQLIPKSKTGAPFGLPIKKKADWDKWKKTFTIIDPLLKQGIYTWAQIKAKVEIHPELPSHIPTLANIHKVGLLGLVDSWPPDITPFIDPVV